MPPALPPAHGQHPAALAPLKVPSARLSTHSPEPAFTLLGPPFPTPCLLLKPRHVLPKNLPPPSQLQPRDSARPPPHLSGSPDAPRPAPRPLGITALSHRPHPRSSLHLRSWAGTRVPGPLHLSSPAMRPAQTSAPTICPSRALTRPRLSSPCCVFSPHLRRRGHQPSAPGAGDSSTLTSSHLSVRAAVTPGNPPLPILAPRSTSSPGFSLSRQFQTSQRVSLPPGRPPPMDCTVPRQHDSSLPGRVAGRPGGVTPCFRPSAAPAAQRWPPGPGHRRVACSCCSSVSATPAPRKGLPLSRGLETFPDPPS